MSKSRSSDATVSERNTAREWTKRQFCEVFGVSEAQLERYFQRGCPHKKKNSRKVVVPMPEGRIWYLDYVRELERKKAAPTSLDEIRKRKEGAQMQMEELKLAREQGKTMLVDEHEKLLADAFSRVRAKLLNFAPRAAGAASGETVQERQAQLEPLVVEIMEELCKADDVPSLESDTDQEAA